MVLHIMRMLKFLKLWTGYTTNTIWSCMIINVCMLIAVVILFGTLINTE